MPDSETLKSILRMFCYGLYVATSATPEGPRAATVSWAAQCSFEPKLLVVGMRRGTAICDAVQQCRRFVLHVVGEHQPEFARAFFKMGQSSAQEISGYRYGLTESGLPVFGAAIAWLECEVEEEAGVTGDHVVFLSRVVDGEIQVPGAAALALRDTNWHYGG